MATNKKVTLKQLMEAAAVLMRFLDEYQTVDKHNADAIVEYEAKVALIAIPLNIKKYERASSYSLVDLLQRKGEQNALTINPGFDGLNTYSLPDLLNATARSQTCPADAGGNNSLEIRGSVTRRNADG
jgi:hypothetical protein